ncbi:MAG TPA: Uma2 family endonuclease [Candidatus Margulisiibacteriota bacterium]|nr:Uma2 family endonuclease [Candidatus Margulisiibacteriota bacterium]
MPRSATLLPQLKPMTVEEWGALDEDVEGELVDGVLEEEEMATFLHELVVMWLARILGTWARQRRGFVAGSEAKIVVGPRRGRKPDVSVYLRGTAPALMDTLVRTAPHLVVEVVSPRPRDARRDRVDKIRDYARAGIRYYWILDPQLRTLEILALEARAQYRVAVAHSRGRLRIPGCPGLVLDLDHLWAEVDEAERQQKRRARKR